jgi:RNA polymerase sigma factor (sigma-70 family)
MMRDDRLAAKAARGERAAFAELYRRHHQRLYRYCLSLVSDPEDAADALQTTMAKALAALERGERVKGVRPWLFRIAHNTAIDLVRLRKPRTPVEEVEEIESSALTVLSAANEAQRRADLAEVVSDIRSLSERQGSALVMRELSALSYAEIAGALDTSPLAARQLVHQARSQLHDKREGRGMDCERVRQELGDADGRRPRDRRVRAHLASCHECTDFGRSIRRRRAALASLAPPLAPAIAGEILGRLLDSGSAGTGAAAAGATAGVAKVATASGVAKVAGAAAGAAAVAAIAGAAVLGGTALDSDEETSRLRPPPAAEWLLRPDLPALGPLPVPRRSEDRSGRPGDAAGSSAAGAAGAPGAQADSGVSSSTAASSPSGPSGNGLPSLAVAESDSPVDLGAVDRPDANVGVAGTTSVVEAPDVPDVPVDLPGGSGGSSVEVPQVEVPEVEVPQVDVPRVEVPGGSDGGGIEVPEVDVPGGTVPGGSGGSGVEVPVVEVPRPSVEVPSSGGIEAPRSTTGAGGGSGPSVPEL